MDFTPLFSQTNACVSFSPGGYFILSAVKDRLVIRRPDRDAIVQSRVVDTSPSATAATLNPASATSKLSNKSVLGKSTLTGRRGGEQDGWITNVAWSPDSEYILACVAKRGVVMVYSMRDESWNARIEAGVEGLTRAEWAPDGRNVLAFSEWGLRVTVWKLTTGEATYIQYPKFPDRGYAFRKDGQYFVLAERHKSRDMLGVYNSAAGFKLAKHFPLPTTSLANIALSPTGNHVAVWESASEFKVHILNLVGQHLAAFQPTDDPLLGVRTIAWHPSGQYLLIGGYDNKVYVLSSLKWREVATLQLTAKLPNGVEMWRPPSIQSKVNLVLPFVRTTTSASTPGIISVTKISSNPPTANVAHMSPYPKSGVTSLQFSATGSLLLVTWEQSPNVVQIFDFNAPSLSPSEMEGGEQPIKVKLRSLVEMDIPVLQAKMSNRPTVKGTSVAICTGKPEICLWNDDRVVDENGERGELAELVSLPNASVPSDLPPSTVAKPTTSSRAATRDNLRATTMSRQGTGEEKEVERQFAVRELKWSLDGKGLALMDREMFCAAFEVES